MSALFVVAEFALIAGGVATAPRDRTKDFMAVLEQNNAMLAETLDRAVKLAYANRAAPPEALTADSGAYPKIVRLPGADTMDALNKVARRIVRSAERE